MKYFQAILYTFILAIISDNASGTDWFAATPWQYRGFGYVGTIYSIQDNLENGETISDFSLGGQLQLDSFTHGYIYRPWIAQFDFKGSFFSTYRQFSLETLEEQGIQQGEINTNFTFFDKSEYPIHLDFDKRKSFLEGNIDLISDVQNLKLHSTYQAKGSPSKYRFSFTNRSDESSLDERAHDVNTLELDWSTNNKFQAWNANLVLESQSLSINPVDGEKQQDRFDSGNLVVNHQWNPDSNRSISSLFTVGKENNKGFLASNNIERYQLTSFAMLTDENDPRLRYTLNFLTDVLTSHTAANGVELKSNETQTMVVNSGVFFDIDENWTASGSLNTTNTQKTGNEELFLSAFAGVRYDHDWDFAQSSIYHISVDNNVRAQKGQQDQQTLTSSFDHGLSSEQELLQGRFSWTLSQQISDQISANETTGDDTGRLGHDVSLQWSTADDDSNTLLMLRGADARPLSGEGVFFKQVTLQLNRQQNLTETSGWNGDVSAQWTKTQDKEKPQEESSITGNLGYHNRQFMGNPLMSLRSHLSFPIDKLVFNNGRRENDRTNWDTVLSYRLGLLELRAELILTDKSRHFRLEIRRSFNLLQY